MSRRKRILVADLLCGAGGSSTGCARALADLGLEMDLVCVNHWPTAIETHKRNHPEARHYVQDIATVRPHLLVPEGYLDLLMASPTCTHHSVARGGKPTSDQQRSDPWHIVTWLTELRVKRIIIENVWEFCGWGPVDPRNGRPIKSKKGVYFHQWISTLRGLGYELEWRKLNAANYGDATTRQRFILKGRNDKKILGWAPITHTKRSDDNLLSFAQLKPWRPARDIIDWKIRGKSIFGRKKALAPKTLMRIYAGAVKHKWPQPFIVVLRNHMSAQGIDVPLPTIAANGLHIGLAQPVVVNMKGRSTATGVDDPLPTQTAHAGHIYAAEPVIMNGRKGNEAKPVSTDPIPTLDTKGGVWLAEPLILSQQNSGAPRSVDEPVPTITTGGAGVEKRQGCARPMLVEPFILNRHGDGYGETRAHSIEEPTPTANCDGGGYLVEPFVLSQASGGSPRAVSDPLPTSTTGGAGGAHALISAYYGANSSCTSEADPLPTVTTKDRFGIVVPVTHNQGGNNGRSVEDPIPMITTAKGGEFAVVMPVTHAGGHDRVQGVDDPIPTVTGANRGELAFITAQFGERDGQSPRTHDLDAPLPVGPTLGHGAVIEPGPQYDILFRMLEPHELAAAMGFNTDDQSYEFAGTKTEQIKQIGNAVSVAMMKAEVKAIMADAAVQTSKAQRSAAA